jgi:hypothetical protein
MRKYRGLIFLLFILVLAMLTVSCTFGDIFPVLQPAGSDTEDGGDDTGQNTEEPQDQDNTDTGEEKPEDKPDILYVSASKLNIRQEASKDAPVVGSAIKGAAVRILETKTDENDTLWHLVSMDTKETKEDGWIAGEYTVTDRYDLLDETLRELDYSPQAKADEYPDNPRVKVKGIYVTIYSAGGQRLDQLIEMANRTGINTFVIDVKDDSGNMLFKTEAAEKYSPNANSKATVKDIDALMKKLKDNNIYTIARIVTFKDPTYTIHHTDRAIVYRDSGKPFTNSDGLIWASPHDRMLWEYDVAVSKEAADAGFNEIQFDYVRFPASDGGKLDKQLDYRDTTGKSKPLVIQDFLKYAYEELSPKDVYISADIYGLVGSVADDMALGQYWEGISNVVDYISPMMYPSHYANHTYGLSVPDAYPYETVYHSAKDSVARNKNIETPAIIRPWIQNFTASWVKGYISYGTEQVKAQIRALEENGIDEFMLWNANNRYSEDAVK